MIRTFLAVLQYDGGDFVGWQRQKTGRSVQGEFERVLARLTGSRIVAHASGRTDAGVHALGIGVSFGVPSKWNSADLFRALNALLPRDCWVESVREMRPGFHARKCATGRRYRYDVGCDPAAHSPFRRRFEWALGRELDHGLLTESAACLVGEHDFVAFAVRNTPQPHWRCLIERAEWEIRDGGHGFRFHVAANRFLHHMVRLMVGTMVDIGLGRRPPGDMATLLTRRDNSRTSPPAPPQGLFFVSAGYPADWYLEEDR